MKQLSYVLSGALFAIGLVVGGMTQPSKVVDFLDFFGNWDPSLALVMGGAVMVHFVSYGLIMKRKSPVYSEIFHVPNRGTIDVKLLAGAALFGIGWGLGGYCPGPAVTSAITLDQNTLVFVGSMLGTMIVYNFVNRRSRGEVRGHKTQVCP